MPMTCHPVNGFLCGSMCGVCVTRERMNLPQCQCHPVHDLCSRGVGHAAPVSELAMTINCPVQQTPGHGLPSLSNRLNCMGMEGGAWG